MNLDAETLGLQPSVHPEDEEEVEDVPQSDPLWMWKPTFAASARPSLLVIAVGETPGVFASMVTTHNSWPSVIASTVRVCHHAQSILIANVI
jgi:hypothetical protein